MHGQDDRPLFPYSAHGPDIEQGERRPLIMDQIKGSRLARQPPQSEQMLDPLEYAPTGSGATRRAIGQRVEEGQRRDGLQQILLPGAKFAGGPGSGNAVGAEPVRERRIIRRRKQRRIDLQNAKRLEPLLFGEV
jgi:hypothetical protein